MATYANTFEEIPTLDLRLARDSSTKPAFLSCLRHALLEVGFLYIANTGIPSALIRDVVAETRAFFDLPDEKKLAIEMKNKPSFLGYSRLNNEITAHKIDHREQFDLSTEHPLPGPDEPLYRNLRAPNQWPDSAALPKFKSTLEDYMVRMGKLATEFTSLISEAIGLAPDAFDKFFDADQQHKLKLVKYPDIVDLGLDEKQKEAQGVGPHKDSMLSSYLLQASPHRGLQVQNASGKWIDVPPKDDTFVVAIGQGLEALTAGVCRSTTHRVLSPDAGSGPRFSVPFFQGVSYDAEFSSLEGWIPREVLALAEGQRRDGGDVEFTFKGGGRWKSFGEATLFNRVKSHQDVAERWYPDLLKLVRESDGN